MVATLQVLLIYLVSASVFANTERFQYHETKTESMSKYQRINHIERYLSTLKGSMDQVTKGFDETVSKTQTAIAKQLLELTTKVELIEKEIKDIKSNMNKNVSKEDI